ncbi:MAG: hypothetical protein IT445_04010 [Phycisphaeraceae bacterium]|nr:hypothetical protein [Phycisphaeraceae bacterium]
MSKSEMIEKIRQCNRSASDEFLLSFDERTLGDYLSRLNLNGHRGRNSVWVRQTTEPAVTQRACA